jgi:MoxR-like ATPase
LPEAQLDRFLMRVSLGFPDRASEEELLRGSFSPAAATPPLLDGKSLKQLQQQCAAQHCSDELINYVLDLVAASRQGQGGLSPRASQALLAAARAWAMLSGRDYVIVKDVQSVLPAVVEHRLDAGRPAGSETPLSTMLLEQVNALR